MKISKFQGPGLYQLLDGKIMHAEIGGLVLPDNIVMRKRAGGKILIECIPEVFEAMVTSATAV